MKKLLLLATLLSGNSYAGCFCVGYCYYGTGDSSHHRHTIDVSCSMSRKDKEREVLKEMMPHFINRHGVFNMSRAEKDIEVRCYNSSRG